MAVAGMACMSHGVSMLIYVSDTSSWWFKGTSPSSPPLRLRLSGSRHILCTWSVVSGIGPRRYRPKPAAAHPYPALQRSWPDQPLAGLWWRVWSEKSRVRSWAERWHSSTSCFRSRVLSSAWESSRRIVAGKYYCILWFGSDTHIYDQVEVHRLTVAGRVVIEP